MQKCTYTFDFLNPLNSQWCLGRFNKLAIIKYIKKDSSPLNPSLLGKDAFKTPLACLKIYFWGPHLGPISLKHYSQFLIKKI